MRTLVIGDIHGCNAALTCLPREVDAGSEDQLIFLGDYIDRGPASRAVIESLLGLEKNCPAVFLRGNHEVMVLDAREDSLKSNLWQSYAGLETLYSYDAAYSQDWPSHIPRAHWEFLERTIRFFQTDTHIFVHAWPIAKRPDH
jgi:serine/threonine protein phosphatase 1